VGGITETVTVEGRSIMTIDDCGVRSLIVTGPMRFQQDWSLRKRIPMGGRSAARPMPLETRVDIVAAQAAFSWFVWPWMVHSCPFLYRLIWMPCWGYSSGHCRRRLVPR
jgi:hypothetical protein